MCSRSLPFSRGACTYPFYIPCGQMNPKGLLMFIPYPSSPMGYVPLIQRVGNQGSRGTGMNKGCFGACCQGMSVGFNLFCPLIWVFRTQPPYFGAFCQGMFGRFFFLPTHLGCPNFSHPKVDVASTCCPPMCFPNSSTKGSPLLAGASRIFRRGYVAGHPRGRHRRLHRRGH